jgi:hypothetical protein
MSIRHNERIVLINIVLALVSQSHGTNKNHSIYNASREAMDLIALPNTSSGSGDEISLLLLLSELIEDLLVKGTDEPIDLDDFKRHIRIMGIYFKEVVELFDAEVERIRSIDNPEEINKIYYYHHMVINNFIEECNVVRIIDEYSRRFRTDPSAIKNRIEIIAEMNTELSPYINSKNRDGRYTGINGVLSDSDFMDGESLGELVEVTQNLYSDVGCLKMDLQGWNELMGPNAGFARGEMVEIQGRSGFGKSDTIRKMLGGIACCNEPYMIDKKKKPLILYLTIEDTRRESIEKIFCNFYMEENDRLVSIRDFSKEEIVEYIKNKITCRGYHFKIIEAEKHKMSPWDVIHLLESLDSDGYEVHVMGLDYMLLLDTGGVPGGMDTYIIKNLYSIISGYTKPKGITVITGGQVSDDIKDVIGSLDLPRDAVNSNYAARSKRILDELDMRLFVNVQEYEGKHYHQLAKGKHRLGKGTSSKHKYAVYEMHSIKNKPAGFIKSDIGGDSMVKNETCSGLRYGDDDGYRFFDH